LNRRKFIRNISLITGGAVILPDKLYPGQPNFIIKSKPDPSSWNDNEINIAWLGHATVLINFYGIIILTDPALLGRVGMYFLGMTWGPSRHTYPALSINELPKPDLILISHAHMDHMDFESLLEITKRFPAEINCITASHTKDVIEELSWKSLRELDWNEKLDFLSLKIRAVEVVHNGWRYPGEKDRSLGDKNGRSYNGYLIESNNKKIFFAGDTAFTEKFKDLRNENIDIAIIPVGGYVPKYYYHCNPEEALIMASEFIGAKYFIPIHSKTFETAEEVNKPLQWLDEIKSDYKITTVIDDIGQTFTLRS
jgi:L-ascorbate metabolism protein UlaG (beta-lactamase superfamily)